VATLTTPRRSVAPSKSQTQVGVCSWPDREVAAVAFRCSALGATEDATKLYFQNLAIGGVRSVQRYVNGIADDELAATLTRADRLLETFAGAVGN